MEEGGPGRRRGGGLVGARDGSYVVAGAEEAFHEAGADVGTGAEDQGYAGWRGRGHSFGPRMCTI